MRKLFLFMLLACIECIVQAQQFGGHPPSTKWNQINNDTLRLIFPANLGLEKQAVDVAATVQRLGIQTAPTIGERVS